MLTGRMGSDPDSRLPLRSRSVSLTAAAREGSEPARSHRREASFLSSRKSTQSIGVRCTLRRSECTIQCNAESVLLYIVLANAQYSKSVECRQALLDEASQSDEHTYNTERSAFEVANGKFAT